MSPVCGYTTVGKDGTEGPCMEPATSWRWYQDVEHEDALIAACDIHENRGGLRMHAAEEAVRLFRRQALGWPVRDEDTRDAIEKWQDAR